MDVWYILIIIILKFVSVQGTHQVSLEVQSLQEEKFEYIIYTLRFLYIYIYIIYIYIYIYIYNANAYVVRLLTCCSCP